MGFEKEVTQYSCGCYYQYFSHDFFNYTKDHQFFNICGNHRNQNTAMEDQNQREKQIIVEATDILVKTMDANNVIRNLKAKHAISKKEETDLLQLQGNTAKARNVLSLLVKSDKPVLQSLRIALIKAGHSDLLQYIRVELQSPENIKSEQIVQRANTEMTDDITTSLEGRCFIHLQDDVYVVAKEFKKNMYIHIRHYDETGQKKIPTKKGVTLNLSRWLFLENKRNGLNDIYMRSLAGKEDEIYTMHLGGGVYITINPKYPTVDIRHFWKPVESDKPVASRKGVALNIHKWNRLCDTIQVMREYVPELDQTCICYYSHQNELESISCKECSPFEDGWKSIAPNKEEEFNIAKSISLQDIL